MVEAGLPDKASHENNAERAIFEVLELDATVARSSSQEPWPERVLLATTDHNNGGFSFNGPLVLIRLREEALLGKNPLTGVSYFTWASGPGAHREASATRTRIVTEPGKPMRCRRDRPGDGCGLQTTCPIQAKVFFRYRRRCLYSLAVAPKW